MRWLRRLGWLVAILAVGLAIVLWRTGHEFGFRPAESVQPLKPAADMRFVDANGVRFAVIEKGDGPLVLMFHGYPATARSWAGVQDRLAAAGYRAVAVSMRGYAPSGPAADGDYSVRALGRDAVALIDALGEDKAAAIIGHDWGASAVYEAAYTAPEKIERVIGLVVPHPRAIDEEFSVLRDAPHFLYYQSPFAERLIWSYDFQHLRDIYALWSPRYAVPEPVMQDVIASFKSPGTIEAALGYYHALVRNGEANRELGADGEITVPALVIAGDSDGAIKTELFARAASAFKGGYRFEVLQGVGHFPQLEAPDRMSDLVLDFLKGEPG